jgi:hypothetical protein
MNVQGIRKVTTLWKMHFDQQSVYKAVMKKEVSGGMRSLCGKGYMIASVCMKEIALMYQDLKDMNRDGEFAGEPEPDHLIEDLPDDCSGPTMAGYLRKKQADLIRRYLHMRKEFSTDDEYFKVLSDHIFVLRQLGRKLRESCRHRDRLLSYRV